MPPSGRAVGGAAGRLRGGGAARPAYLVCDGTVPRTKLPEGPRRGQTDRREIQAPHRQRLPCRATATSTLILFDDRDPDELDAGAQGGERDPQGCADLGGTISGEHGIGTEKLVEMSLVFRESDIETMRGIKAALDPKGLRNPGKVIPRGRSRGP